MQNPRLVIMTGTCAGDRKKVELGDIIVADRTFQYDTGKITLDEKGHKVHTHDIIAYMVDPRILRFVQMFDKWKRDISNLKRPQAELLQNPMQPPRRHIAPIASSSAIRSDNPFSEIQVPVRGTIAVDMEGAAFYRAAQDFPGISSLLVKGVSDFADSSKHDNYQEYASAASAIYALSFIREYVTHELIPTTGLSRSPSLLPYRLEETPEAP